MIVRQACACCGEGTGEVSHQMGITGSEADSLLIKYRSQRIVDLVRSEAFGLRKPSEGSG